MPDPALNRTCRYLIVEGTICHLGADHEDELLAQPYSASVEFHGHLNDPLDGVSRAQVCFGVGEERRTSEGRSVGAALMMKPFAAFEVSTTAIQFGFLWQLAMAGHCRSVQLLFRPAQWDGVILYGWRASTIIPESLFGPTRTLRGEEGR